MARILIAVSSVGLGHAARARVYGALLDRMGHEVEYYAPEPAGSYIRAWGGRVISYSRQVESLSVYLERYWVKTGSGLIGLKAALEEHQAALKAGLGLIQNIDLDHYDLIISEESWEVMSVAERIQTRKAWIADFVGYKPVGLRGIPAAWVVNRFLLRRYKYFDALFYVGLPGRLEWRMTPIGPKASQVLRGLFRVVGPIPAFLPWEQAERNEARRRLGIPSKENTVLIQLGGTRAGEKIASKAASAALTIGLTPAIARGPRAKPSIPKEAIDLGYEPLLPTLLKAFDCAYVLAGLSTISSLAAAGIPAVLHPLPRHFEQEENAEKAPRLWPNLFTQATGNPARDLAEACSKTMATPDTRLHQNAETLARMLAELAED